MGAQAAQVMTERSVGASGSPRGLGSTARKPALSIVAAPTAREQLRAAVADRLQKDSLEMMNRLSEFLADPDRAGVAQVSLVLSESALTSDLWKAPRQVPEARAHLGRTLELPSDVDDAGLLRALMAEVHTAFEEFEDSRAGHEFRARYDALLQHFDLLDVMPLVLGHDVGPMLQELARLGIECPSGFARSLFIEPRTLGVVPPTQEEVAEGQVLVSGVSLSQLGMVVAQMRQYNPTLKNRQVRSLFGRALIDGEERKSLGRAEVQWLHDSARQLLRLQYVERLSP